MYKNCIDQKDRARIERLEIFDEFEEWNLMQTHYCIAIGAMGVGTGGLEGGFGFPLKAANREDPRMAALQALLLEKEKKKKQVERQLQ